MAKLIAITGSNRGVAHTRMAAESLRMTARSLGHELELETLGGDACLVLEPEHISKADAAIVASDLFVDVRRFDGRPIHTTSIAEAIRHPREVIAKALGQPSSSGTDIPVGIPRSVSAVDGPSSGIPLDTDRNVCATEIKAKSIVAITACPTGIAHTFMAAAALKKGAATLGHTIHVETQGSVGAKNTLAPEQIAAADAVVIAADTAVDLSRFAGKRLHQTSTKAALHDGAHVIGEALKSPAPAAGSNLADNVEQLKTQRSAKRSGPYKHLMTGVSHMLPFVTAGGLIIALAFAVGGVDAAKHPGTLGAALMQIGGGAAYQLYVAVLAAFIAYSIADRPGLTSGLVGGLLATQLGAGFLGGIAAGFLAGYVTKGIDRATPLPPSLAGLKPVLILPLFSTLIVGLLMVFFAGPWLKQVTDGLAHWLGSMQTGSAVLLGLIVGAMMAFDMGGPVNKAAYAFAIGLLAAGQGGPIAAAVAAGMTPPLGLALATMIARRSFDAEERDAGKVAAVLGLSFITEGAIPFAAKDPFRIIPSIVAGSATTGALVMAFRSTIAVPHGGVFILLIPNAATQVAGFAVAIAAGTLVTAMCVIAAKRSKPMLAERPAR